MPLAPPESYELDHADTPPLLKKQSFESDGTDDSDFGESDPLDGHAVPYEDKTQEKDGGHVYKSPAWLNGQRSKSSWQRLCIPSRFCCYMILLFFLAFFLLLSAGGFWVYKTAVPTDGQSDPWYPSPRGGTLESWKESYEKAAKLVDQMSLVEKVNVTTGTGWSMDMCVGNTGQVERLGFPSLCLQDGPLGLRFVDNITAWPAGITVAATWNRELMYKRGQAHGFEAKKKGVNVLLGPSVGPIGRLPAGGRNWEAFGPDPYLQGAAAFETVRGIQENGVMATIKHYVGNEQEHFRQSWEWGTPNAISSNIDDRTLHEMYVWPFGDAVHAGVASVMCSYNQVNNSYACQNSKLLNGILKDELGFQGFVQSDWLAQRSGVASALAGLDMTMPGDGLGWQDGKSLFGAELTRAILNTSVPMQRLNDMALRVVAAWYQMGQDDESEWPRLENGGSATFSSWTNDARGKLHPGSPDSEGDPDRVINEFVPVRNTTHGGDHDALARAIAAEGIVMVKNEESFLPLSPNGTALLQKIDANGSGTRKAKVGIFGEDAFLNPKGINSCEDRSCNEGTLAMGWGSGAVELPYLVSPAHALRENFHADTVDLAEWKTNDIKDIQATASDQDVCIVFITSDAGEGYLSWGDVRGDRNDLYSQKGGDALVEAVAKSCAHTLVVFHTVGPVIVENWIDIPSIKGVLIPHLPGQESGNALADVVFGVVNPSGHLPYTIAKHEDDYGPNSKIMYYPNGVVPQQNFTEGLYTDYRYFDKYNITPRYEFGFGLSYVDFQLSSLIVQPLFPPGNMPKERPEGLKPPQLDESIPDPSTALWPKGMRKLSKYIYPYLDSTSDVTKGQYPYPKGYNKQHPPSPAGGGEGGNPDLWETAVKISATLTNLGTIPADAVVQLYISYPPNVTSPITGAQVDMPVKVLRGFQKIHITADNNGKRQPVHMELTRRDLSYWDVHAQNWVMPMKGDFKLWLGFSSRDESTTSLFSMGGLLG